MIPPTVEAPDRPLSTLEVFQRARNNLLDIIPRAAYHVPFISGKGVDRWHMAMEPQALSQMLREKVDIYPKSKVTKRMFTPAGPNSIFIVEGAQWRWQRRTAAPIFQHRNLMTLAPFMTAAAERAADRIAAKGGAPQDFYEEMVTVTFDVISDVALSGRDLDRARVANNVSAYFDTIGRISLLDILGLPSWVPRPAHFSRRRGTQEMQAMVDGLIADRQASTRRDDLLQLLVDAEDPETSRRFSAEELRDNLLAFLVAGYETTTLALAWALYLLAHHPEAQDRVAEEATAIAGTGPVTGEHALPYARQVIDEAMRLYPPAAFVSRTAQADDNLAGHKVQRGDTVMIPIYALHRHRMWWDRPDEFEPDNFAPGKVKARDKHIYLPFIAGPRICIGMQFALMEAQIVLATLVRRFRFRPVEGAVPHPVLIFTLRPQGGVILTVEDRHARVGSKPAVAEDGVR